MSVKEHSCAGEDELMQSLNKMLSMREMPETAGEEAFCNLKSSLSHQTQTALTITAETSAK